VSLVAGIVRGPNGHSFAPKPKGQRDSARGFNPGERVPSTGSALKGRQISACKQHKNMMYEFMSQSLALVLVHIIFSTKNRIAFLHSPDLQSEVHAYSTGTLRALECQPLRVGGTADHVHVLAALSRKISLAELVKNLKTSSTRIVKSKGESSFAWQAGYGAFSVSQSAKEAVVSYIASQDIHHRKMTFQEEFRLLLEKHRIPFDERYIWE
jgi:putative transposase